jgi:hypothetical protein
MKRKRNIPNPLGERILEYIRDNDTNITALSLSAGLSAGSLRQLIINPDRRPTLETCLRISQVTGIDESEILELAGYEKDMAGKQYHPDRNKLLEIFSSLPSPHAKRQFVIIADAFGSAVNESDET